MNFEDFDKAVDEGLVSRKERGSLALYCYTPRCAHERVWTPITRAARGIIFDRKTRQIVARPFEKFFNLGELPECAIDALPADGFRVEEKLDGSLGVIWFDQSNDRWTLTTKGAFDSEQAIYAREKLLPKYEFFPINPLITILVEILYPENRIIIDYEGREELVLLGMRHQDGYEYSADEVDDLASFMRMPRVPTHPYSSVLDLPFSNDSEGYVVRFKDGRRVKIKSPRYVQIHRLLEYRSPRRVLDMIADGTYEELRQQIPDDIAGDFDDVHATLKLSLAQIKYEAHEIFKRVQHLRGDRKSFALAAKALSPPRSLALVFAILDGKDVDRLAVRTVRNELKLDLEGR